MSEHDEAAPDTPRHGAADPDADHTPAATPVTGARATSDREAGTEADTETDTAPRTPAGTAPVTAPVTAGGTATAPDAAKPRRRGRPKVTPDPDLAARLVNETRKLFIERGYARTTMDDIAAHCRVSKRTLYRLFPAKSALFQAIIEAHRPAMLALPGNYSGLPLSEALARILRVDISAEEDLERIAVLRLVVMEAQSVPELAAIVRDHGAEPSRRALADWLGAQQAAGRMRPLDPMLVSGMLMNMVFGVTRGGRVGPPDVENWPDLAERDHHIRLCIDLFLNGALPRGPQGPAGTAGS
ncbi:TetR family transcriptional regulator [Paroceanicella profunda]|uniref:TetR family transcriptional regulator n=1 Tax=Paroceanicella profunda TaxID=2579971 RepID=A0A5B8FRV4_9RHOB|nr:TetR/AcrR family transcriptional regulator [Paroceanicella profunda]QDL91476.1 TetR family transcriptional regulator [Paroceanicella profunda]